MPATAMTSGAALQLLTISFAISQQATAMTLSWQTNTSLEQAVVSSWRGIPIEEVDPSKYPEFVQWLSIDPPEKAANLMSQAQQDAKGNKGPPHFGDLQSYLSKCQAQDPDVVEIPTWMGRMGNRIWQVLNAVRIAEATGRKFVKLPKAGGGLDHHLFASPEGRLIEVQPSKSHDNCDFIPVSGKMYAWHHDCRFLFFNRCRTTVKERKEAYQKYIMPLLKDDIMDRCEIGQDDEVTIHVRNGDVALHNDLNPEMRPEHRQPPCAYFHKVIQTGNNGGPFKKIQLVYSNEEPVSPCIDDILSKHKDKVVMKPAPTLAGDVCHILRAKNVATTMSSFATVLKMLNPGLQHLFFVNMLSPKIMTPEQYDIQMDYYEFRVKEACEVFPQVTSYTVPELYQKESFFLNFPEANMVVESCKGDPKSFPVQELPRREKKTTSKRRRWFR